MKMRLTALILCLALLLGAAGLAEAEEYAVPEIEVKEFEIPENDALAFIRDMKVGWNLGNSFDAIDCNWLKDPLDYESGWCGVKATEGLMDALKDAGFNTLRIPISWHNHVDADYNIDEAWLNRTEEVASWAYKRGMYVIINIHHDEDQFVPRGDHYEESARYVERIWRQVAARFEPYGDHLIMESMNEPRLTNSKYEWYFDSNAAECQEAADCLNRLNQLFVDTVRATGGNNAERYLMVPGYDANPEYACNGYFKIPEDTADNRIIISAHAYTPYNFALEMPGISTFSLDNSNQTGDIARFMNKLYDTYVSKGIPVLIGEFGAMIKGDNLQARVDWASFYVANARARGMTVCWWDNNVFSGNGERFGLIDRKTLEWKAPELLKAIMEYCE